VPASQPLALIGSAVTGLGLGATVAPALFVAGFSLPAASLQRVFAIVELLRAVAAFMIAPIFVHFAAGASGGLNAGTGNALWVGLGLAIVGAGLGVAVYALSGARPQAPDIEGFLEGRDAAWPSPPLLAKASGSRPMSGSHLSGASTSTPTGRQKSAPPPKRLRPTERSWLQRQASPHVAWRSRHLRSGRESSPRRGRRGEPDCAGRAPTRPGRASTLACDPSRPGPLLIERAGRAPTQLGAR
jgi:hypothetical protein